ncbi:MAG: IclR family transcriptional regulator [Sphaerochaeta sp.]
MKERLLGMNKLDESDAEEKKKIKTNQSIDRAFDILEALADETDGLTLTELSKKTKLHTSTVYRMLQALNIRNYIDKDENNNRYSLGIGFVELASLRLKSLELKIEAQSNLSWLQETLGQVVFLGVKNGFDVNYIDMKGDSKMRDMCSIGFSLPLHCTGLGKALLMDFNEMELRQFYKDHTFSKLTPYSITNIDELVKANNQNRERGYSIDYMENKLNTFCVAAPIYDYRSKVIAAISTSWKGEPNRIEEVSLSVLQAANNISHRMGYLQKR